MKAKKNIDAFEFTYFIRGELFVLIDFLLTSNFNIKSKHQEKISSNEMQAITSICELYCNLYDYWITSLPDLFSTVKFK